MAAMSGPVWTLCALGQSEKAMIPESCQCFCAAIAANVDFALALAGARNVIGGLHPHECVHLGAKRFFYPEGHFSGQIGLAVKQV